MTREIYLNIGSVTYAHKAVSVLVRNGFKARIVRSFGNACNYGVSIPAETREEVVKLLRENGVPVTPDKK